ncbi:glycosyltransferase family 1 protein [Aneurinibacillus terranovensis]|uniref:glycosyltransferase family 1 protein n=1 Tax=Aneurinibacillus terranovensis TaxID=278991 RepID=UPI0004157984|nr:glycosyltransferase family 1 protein [Aneurinibacillus terranovensis]
MKIIQGPLEIAGQMGILNDAFKKEGHQAMGYNYYHTSLGYKDNILPADGNEITRITGDAINHFEIFHYHYALTFFNDFRDLELLAEAGKPAFMHHWGSDVRKGSIAKLFNPYVNTADSPPEEEIHQKMMKISKYIPVGFVQDYEVLPYVSPYYKEVHVIPIAINLEKFEPVYPNPSENTPLIIHAPTQPEFKGTARIEEVIEKLKKEFSFRYQRIEKMSNEKATALYRNADIIIDQIFCGSYGLFSVEAMALGKPVICYVRDDLMCQYNTKPPICTANPDTIYDVLKELLSSGELRRKKGMDGRKFVESYHDNRIVAKQLLPIYERFLTSKRNTKVTTSSS